MTKSLPTNTSTEKRPCERFVTFVSEASTIEAAALATRQLEAFGENLNDWYEREHGRRATGMPQELTADEPVFADAEERS
jgi:hypothetical protein